MRIRIEKRFCQGCERCVNICPEVFRMWGEFLKANFEVTEPEKYRQAVIRAIEECPYDAITVDF
jgi:ferredoxin